MAVEPSSVTPVYLQIADHVRRAIAARVYQPGRAIPSLRNLAGQLAVNPNTVQRAYEELEREGLLVPRKGLGMFVTRDGAVSAQRMAEAAVIAAFVHSIRAARAAQMPPDRIRAAFETAWQAPEETTVAPRVPAPASSPLSRSPGQQGGITTGWRCWR